ncbi:MAG: hypothetical protein M0R17_02485 [Candidatus Omnitrophica bacterium]|jgi:hypothetical protein|nr:hypothetical protein [Candidatus Omnitrophota bacterium]
MAHEIAVSIETLPSTISIDKKGKRHITHRRSGDIVAPISDFKKVEKWLEIVCSFGNPKHPNHELIFDGLVNNCDWKKNKHVDGAKGIWSKELQDKWFEADCKSSTEYDRIANLTRLWNSEIKQTIGWIDHMGKEPNGVEDLVNTWQWSKHEKSNFYVVVNSDANEQEMKELSNRDISDSTDVREIRRKNIDWESDLLLSNSKKNNIKNRNTVVHPDFSNPMSKVKIS